MENHLTEDECKADCLRKNPKKKPSPRMETLSDGDIDLMKVIIHRLSMLEKEMLKKKDHISLMESYRHNEDQITKIINAIDALKTSIQLQHLENINSDEVLLRSIRQTQERKTM